MTHAPGRLLLAAALIALAVRASAQTVPPGNPWSHGSTLSLFGGAAPASSRAGGLVGLGVGWEISPVVGIEGTGSWLDRGRGAEAFAAALTLQGTFANPTPVKPFLEAGVGLYRATFDTTRAGPPDFYARRLAAHGPGFTSTDAFTDPSFVLGGGANLFLGRHIAIRPDVNVQIVRRDRRSHTVTAGRVHLVYHFEDHPVTPR